MPTYSFLDVHAALTGPGGSVSLSEGDGVAAEGISIEPVEDKDIMTVGSDGGIMHSLVGSRAAIATVRLFKTNPLNAVLQNMYNHQTQSSLTHGKNVITVRDVIRGDTTTFEEAAFMGKPNNIYAKEGNILEWRFGGHCDTQLGFGAPEIV